MKYMLMFYETAASFDPQRDAKTQDEYWGAWTAYVQSLSQSGLVRGGEGLKDPSTATTLKIRNGKRIVQDGPFADAKEQLGGFFIIETPSLDEALEWAARAPCAKDGGVEVRPVLEMNPHV